MAHPQNGEMSGVLHVLGVGPGHPDLLTLKVVRLLGSVDVLAYPVNGVGFGLARDVVSEYVGAGVKEYGFRLPVGDPIVSVRAAYGRVVRYLDEVLSSGSNVGLLCLGDSGFYGSASYVIPSVIACGHKVEIIPGVASPMAAAAAIGEPLVQGDGVLRIVPAILDCGALREELGRGGSCVIVKIGRHIGKLRRVLQDLGLEDRAVFVKDATCPEQRIVPFKDVSVDDSAYFSILMIGGQGDAGCV